MKNIDEKEMDKKGALRKRLNKKERHPGKGEGRKA
jgi:hypothetical protein